MNNDSIREQIKWACLRSNAPAHMTNPELRDTMELMLAVIKAAQRIRQISATSSAYIALDKALSDLEKHMDTDC